MGNFSAFLIRNCVAQPNHRWPCQQQPKTLSFRTPITTDVADNAGVEIDSPDGEGDQSVERVIERVKSATGDRLLFEPGETKYFSEYPATPIAIEAERKNNTNQFIGGAVALTMDSKDPLVDFRRSMEEMVDAHHMQRNWVCLEELLRIYLTANEENNHGYILTAFVDLLLALSYSSSSSPSSSSPSSYSPVMTSSSCSCETTPCLTSLSLETEEGEKEEDNENCCRADGFNSMPFNRPEC